MKTTPSILALASILVTASLASANTVSTTSYTTTTSDFDEVAGVCKPRNHGALLQVRELQVQLNRIATLSGFATVATDGFVGPQTLALFEKVQAISDGSVMGDGSTCMGVAPDVDVLAAQVEELADSLL